MSYFNRSDLDSRISESELPDFLDDSRSGSETSGLLEAIISNASNAADALVSSIYTTPFNPVPAKIKEASIIFCCEMLYQRRLVPGEKNPFTSQADYWRKVLQEIGAGTLPLDVNTPTAFTPGFAITSPNLLTDNTF